MRPSSKQKVVAVCVTYGNRWHFVERALNAAVRQGVSRIILIDNGTPDACGKLAENAFPQIVISLRLNRNIGSAGGFAVGLERAKSEEPDWILLLDDDNEMEDSCLEKLLKAPHPIEDARLALRPEHQIALMEGQPPDRVFHKKGAFLGFHLSDILYKISIRRTPPNNAKNSLNITCPQAPYSGLLLPANLLATIGIPRKDFMLYSDDSEWSSRIISSGHKIHLVADALIRDLDASWHIKSKKQSSILTWLTEGSDFRAYYACRNQIAFERLRDGRFSFTKAMNAVVYLTALFWTATIKGRQSRLRVLIRAIWNGWIDRLGEDKEYPLP